MSVAVVMAGLDPATHPHQTMREERTA